jgi:RND family efflux transporter MFP subunit
MKNIKHLLYILPLTLFLVSCGSGDGLEEKKAQLEAYKKQLAEVKASIRQLENEIASEDSTFTTGSENILVSTYVVKPEPFIHQIDVRGSVESRKNVMISAETMGRIESIPVTEGQEVNTGTLLMKLDADILENNIAEVRTQLELATTVYERQSNLWEQNIGSEIQYLQAKNNKESLERRLKTLQSQLNQAYIRAPFAGVVEEVPVKQGEMAQPGIPLIRIVNQNQMYITADVSEAYLGKIAKGDQVTIFFPTQEVEMKSTIASVGKVINQENRTFSVEVSIPRNSNYEFRPNQVVVLTLTDYLNEDAMSVPTRIIQSDDQGKYVFGMTDQEGKRVAKKIRITTGKSFDNKTEVLSGLSNSDIVIEKGYRDVNEGVEVSLSTASL